MRFAGVEIVVGLLMIPIGVLFLAAGQVPELQPEPRRIGFQLAGELVTAVGVIIDGVRLLRGLRWAASRYLTAVGMLLYSVFVGPGYLAQRGQ
jgi:hypothetical protein